MRFVSLSASKARKTPATRPNRQSWLLMADSWRETAKLQEVLETAGGVYKQDAAAAPQLAAPIETIGTSKMQKAGPHHDRPDLNSGLEARENAFQCLHCFLFIQLF